MASCRTTCTIRSRTNPTVRRELRIGPEALEPGLQVGDKVRLDFLVGVVTAIHRL